MPNDTTAADRHCCDGRCTSGACHCPAYAPGVIDGPHSSPAKRRQALAWIVAAALLSIVWAVLLIWGAWELFEYVHQYARL